MGVMLPGGGAHLSGLNGSGTPNYSESCQRWLSTCPRIVAMTFCEVPFAKVPIGIVCTVSPLDVIASAFTDNVTDCNVCEFDVGGGVGVDVKGPVGEDDLLSQAAMQSPRTKTKRTRFMESSLSRRLPRLTFLAVWRIIDARRN